MSRRILVVEDHEENRRIIRDLLTSAGLEMIEALTGEEGVRLDRKGRLNFLSAARLLVRYGNRQSHRPPGNQAREAGRIGCIDERGRSRCGSS